MLNPHIWKAGTSKHSACSLQKPVKKWIKVSKYLLNFMYLFIFDALVVLTLVIWMCYCIFACVYVQDVGGGLTICSTPQLFISVTYKVLKLILWELVAQRVMLHALTEWGNSQPWILSFYHSQEVMLLLVSVVSRGTNGVKHCNEPFCQFMGFLWFSSLCVSCCKKHALKMHARDAFDRLGVPVEEFCTCPHSSE